MLDIVAFGEILWDLIDGTAHIGGAPFNLAAHAVQCGLRAAVVSALGDDVLGQSALAEMRRLGVDARWTRLEPDYPTGTVSVTLQAGQPDYTIHEDVAWDHITLNDQTLAMLQAQRPQALCFGTLAQRSAVSRATLSQLIESLQPAVAFYDVNLRQHFWSLAAVQNSLQHANIVKVNADEAATLGRLLYNGAQTPQAFGAALLAAYANLTVIVITLGADGCVVCERDQAALHLAVEQVEVVSTVGAGDAFSAAFLAAWLRGADAVSAAGAGNARGARVATFPGAIPEIRAM